MNDNTSPMQPTQHTWYHIENVNDVDSPSLLVYPERVLANIRTAKSMVKDIALLRPHVKTHKSADAARLQLSEGITKFKCATIAEAEMLALAGARDVLLAYQPVGPKVRRLLALTRTYPLTTFACLVDDVSAAQSLAEAFQHEPGPLAVFIDLNVGMNRTGIAPGESAMRLFQAVSSMKGIRPVGLHAYDGHIRDKDPTIRSQRCSEAFAPVVKMQAELSKTGSLRPRIVAGGSPSFPVHARSTEVECSPGTFIYWDKEDLDGLPDQRFLPAALVLTRVISRPTRQLLCLDLGHKSIASEKDILHRVHFLNAPASEVVSQSEEHLLLKVADSGQYAVGNVFYGLPYHICPTCALYERAATIVDHKAEGEWTMIARDRMIHT